MRRLLQLLNLRRTIRLERDMERLMVSSANMAEASLSLAKARCQSTGIDYAAALDFVGAVRANLETIQHYLATGQVGQAKLLLDALVLVTKAEAV